MHDRCPPSPDEVAESYCFGRLSPQDQETFENHYLLCPRCAQLVESTQEFLDVFRVVATQETSITRRANSI